MTRRCPNCGGLVGEDARWCGQCLTPLDAEALEAAPRPPGPSAGPTERGSAGPGPRAAPTASAGSAPRLSGPIRPGPQGVVWECPTCQTESPIDATTCQGCETPFARLLEEERRDPQVEPARATRLSLLFPGLGHAAAGRGAEGLARAVVFAYAFATALTIVIMRAGAGFGPFLPLLLISATAAIGLYAVTALDAGRLPRGEDPILSTRVLLYGAVALMLLTIVIFLVLGTRLGGRG
jgi:hypothetical protein